MTPPSPLFSTWEPDPNGMRLGTRFYRFTTPRGVDGLARSEMIMNGEMILELLAINATNPGRGQFRRFLEDAAMFYSVIAVYHIWNDRLHLMLKDRGFVPFRGAGIGRAMIWARA